MLLMIIGTVMVIDMLSGSLRHRLLAMETAS
jgi:ABC-type phosphate/phosphonate transport system permease subunit